MKDLPALLLCGVILGIAGCGNSETVPREFVSSEAVLALGTADQQTQVQEILKKYCGTPSNTKLLGDDGTHEEQLELGRQVYQRRCVPCHGYTGDGAGPAAQYLKPLPRDYRKGLFKFTSTKNLEAPTRDDLRRVIVNGAPGTAMPAFKLLPAEEVDALIDYVLALTHRGELEVLLADAADNAGDAGIEPETITELIEIVLGNWENEKGRIVHPNLDDMTPYTMENIVKGREFFLDPVGGCNKCHGLDGRGSHEGDGLKDSWGHEDPAADLTTGLFHGGGRPEDIYRRISAGITGTPMPAFGQLPQLKEDPELIWNVAHYVRYLADSARRQVAAEQVERRRQQGMSLIESDKAAAGDADSSSDDAAGGAGNGDAGGGADSGG